MHTGAASRRVRALPDSAVSVVRVRAAVVDRTDSATAIDQGRAVAVLVKARVRARVRGVGLARVAVGNAAVDQLDS